MRLSESRLLAPMTAMLFLACGGGGDQSATANPCAANPCAADAANPCAANPCAAGGMIDVAAITQGDRVLDSHGMTNVQLVARGAELWDDKSLSAAGTTSCSTCHAGYGQINASFAEPYPHEVKMAKERAGLDEVTAAEMVQLCMVIPMSAEPLDWGSVELAALSAHVGDLQKGFPGPAGAMNPCAANPCAANPCGANPCAADAANPCAANPCAANPCGG